MSQITFQETEALVKAWRNRAQALGYKPGTKTYAKLEVEFFVGAIAMLLALGRTHPPVWELLIMSGRSISATLDPEKPDEPTTKGKESL